MTAFIYYHKPKILSTVFQRFFKIFFGSFFKLSDENVSLACECFASVRVAYDSLLII